MKKELYEKGIVSNYDAITTYDKLINFMKQNDIVIFAEFDCQKTANLANVKINFNRTVVFCKPELGAKLIKDEPTFGINMPMKLQVYEDENHNVFVRTNDLSKYLVDYSKLDKDIINNIQNKIDSMILNAIN